MQKKRVFNKSVQNQHDNCMVNSLTWLCGICKEKIEYGTVWNCIVGLVKIEYGTEKCGKCRKIV